VADATTYTTPPEINRYGGRALIVGIVFSVLFVVGLFMTHGVNGEVSGPAQFFRSYLLGYVFWTGIAVGCLALLMLQHLTGGAWGMVIRRVLEAGTRTLPLMALLFIPFAIFGLPHVYEWVHPTQFGAHGEALEIIKAKQGYLNVPFFLLRTAIYFVIWLALMFFMNKWSLEQDRTAERRYRKAMARWSAPGLVLFVLTTTFASIDWVMSLDPEWFSTIFGLLFVAGWTLSAFSFVIAMMMVLATRKPLEGVVGPGHFHDLGKLLLAFVMLWSYFSFSQFLIIWSGNIPEETKWYLHRLKGGWGWVGIALVVLHFAFPFFMLLSRDLKRNARRLAVVAGVVLVMRFVDLMWLIVPEYYEGHLHISWMDIAAPLAIGGLWFAYFAYQLQQRPLLPINDPELGEALERAHAHH
jgi:hypothetical protein